MDTVLSGADFLVIFLIVAVSLGVFWGVGRRG